MVALHEGCREGCSQEDEARGERAYYGNVGPVGPELPEAGIVRLEDAEADGEA